MKFGIIGAMDVEVQLLVEAMKKNNGEMEISCEQKEFMVRLYFPRKAPIQGNENR